MSGSSTSEPPVSQGKTVPHLRLVASNPPPAQEEETPLAEHPRGGFTAQIRKKGDALYALIARDPSHCLECRFDLEFHEDVEDLEPMSVVCRFPDMPAEELFEIVGQDETLYGMLLIQFQMKVLEKLLLFCSEHCALNLVIYATLTPEEGHALGIYSNLAIYEDLVPAERGKEAQLVIPTTTKTFDRLIDLMDRLNLQFRQTLWQEQRFSAAIRAYLKSNPGLNFFD